MRFLHTADWHVGKKLNGFDLLAEQHDAFLKINQLAKDYKVDAVVVAGDLYDRSVPSEEAVEELNKDLIQMNLKEGWPLLAVSGNHDSAVRLATGGTGLRRPTSLCTPRSPRPSKSRSPWATPSSSCCPFWPPGGT